MKKKLVVFPLRLDDKMQELISKASFVTSKSKHQYCLDAIKEKALIDSQKIIIKEDN